MERSREPRTLACTHLSPSSHPALRGTIIHHESLDSPPLNKRDRSESPPRQLTFLPMGRYRSTSPRTRPGDDIIGFRLSNMQFRLGTIFLGSFGLHMGRGDVEFFLGLILLKSGEMGAEFEGDVGGKTRVALNSYMYCESQRSTDIFASNLFSFKNTMTFSILSTLKLSLNGASILKRSIYYNSSRTMVSSLFRYFCIHQKFDHNNSPLRFNFPVIKYRKFYPQSVFWCFGHFQPHTVP